MNNKKLIKAPLNVLNKILDKNTGLIICFLADAFSKFTEDDDRQLRKIEIRLNDYFSFSYDLEKNNYVCDKGELKNKN